MIWTIGTGSTGSAAAGIAGKQGGIMSLTHPKTTTQLS